MLSTLQRAQGLNSPEDKISKWESIHIEYLETMRGMLTTCSIWQKPLAELAAWYVRQVLELVVIPTETHFRGVIECALQKDTPTNSFDKMSTYLTDNVPNSVARCIKELFSSAVAETVRKELQMNRDIQNLADLGCSNQTSYPHDTHGTTSTETSHPNQLNVAEPTSVVLVHDSGTKRKRMFGTIEIKNRGAYSRLNTTKQKLDFIWDVFAEHRHTIRDLTNASRSWFLRNAVRIGTCIEKCHDSDVKRMVEHVGNDVRAATYHCDTCKSYCLFK